MDTLAHPLLAALPIALAGAACAGEMPPAAAAVPVVSVGTEALLLLQRERAAQRRTPRLLPLATLPTERGRVWLGVGREPDRSRGGTGARLEIVWVVPVGG